MQTVIHIRHRELWWILDCIGMGFEYDDIEMYRLGMRVVWELDRDFDCGGAMFKIVFTFIDDDGARYVTRNALLIGDIPHVIANQLQAIMNAGGDLISLVVVEC